VEPAPGEEIAVIELCPSRPGATRLARLPGVAASGRARRVEVTWHDDVEGTLRATGHAASKRDGVWRLERLAPGPDGTWPPGASPPVLAEATTASGVGMAGAVEVARFTGREWSYTLDGLEGLQVLLLRGAVEASGTREAACRLRLTGPASLVEAACAGLGEALDLAVPRGGVAACILGAAPAPPGAEPVTAGASVGEFIADALPSIAWPVLLGTAAVSASMSVEGIHETRVAVRRLRSVLGVLRQPTASGAAETLRPMLHDLAGCLGAARDWDVFLGGVAAQLAERLGEDRDAARLLAAARRQQSAAHAALGVALAGPRQRALERELACLATLRPWKAGPHAAMLADGAAGFAAAVLDKRLRRVRRAGRGFKHRPPDALHALRKDGKRLRYAAEAFAPLFPGTRTRRFLKRLRAVQGTLGEMQDAEVARDLLARLGGAGRGYAGGLAIGFAEGRGDALRTEAQAAWRQFSKAEAFWTAD
jgi:triphosphatase